MSVTFTGQTCSDEEEQAVLSKFDDYPIHQTPEPIAHPASSDKDTYERYWFNGYSRTGDMYLGIGTALYPISASRTAGFLLSMRGVSTPSTHRLVPAQNRARCGSGRSISRSSIRCGLVE